MNNRYGFTSAAILCLLWACCIQYSFAEESDPKSEAPEQQSASEGSVLIEQARQKLSEYQSIKAELSERVAFQDHSFTAKGSYLQGKRNQVRLEMTVELGRNRGALLEICDGNILYTRHDIIDQTQVTRRDVQKILQAVEQSGGRFTESSTIADLGLGGIAGILAGIATDMNFSKPIEDNLEETPVFIVNGEWNDTFRDRFRTDPKLTPKEVQLPTFVPDQVRIVLQKDTLFPRRITYLKRNSGGKATTPMLVLEFSKVIFNGKVSNEQFQYVPDQHTPLDVTEYFVSRINAAATPQEPPATTNAPMK